MIEVCFSGALSMDLLKGEEEEELRVGFRSSEVQEAWCCSRESHGEKMGRHQ